jgi:hypothetical protein
VGGLDEKMETEYVVTNRWAKNKIGSPGFWQSVVHAAVISRCGRERRHMSALLLGVIAVFLFGCRHPDETITSYKASPISSNKNCPYELSESFRDAAGDAFDKLQSLESNELQGKLFYQPAYQEAGVAVSKAKRIASQPDDVKLSNIIASYLDDTDLYRIYTKSANTMKTLESMAAESPDVADKVAEDSPNLHQERSNAVGKLREIKEKQRKNRALIGACLNASHETEIPPDYQSLIKDDERRKLENERYWAARDAAAAASKRKVNKEPQFVDEPRSKPQF